MDVYVQLLLFNHDIINLPKEAMKFRPNNLPAEIT